MSPILAILIAVVALIVILGGGFKIRWGNPVEVRVLCAREWRKFG